MRRLLVAASLVMAGCGGIEPPAPNDGVAYELRDGQPWCGGTEHQELTGSPAGAEVLREWFTCEWLCANYGGKRRLVAVDFWRDVGGPWEEPVVHAYSRCAGE